MMQSITSIDGLISVISQTDAYFQKQAQKQVNVALTLRNWLFGLYLVEYELNGADRAQYGKQALKEIATRTKHLKGFSESNLYVFKQFYLEYPQIFQTASGKLQDADFERVEILQSVTGKSKTNYRRPIWPSRRRQVSIQRY